MNKKWYTSKTLWVNVLAIIGIVTVGAEFDAQTVAVVLAVLNALLRRITKTEITW